LEIREDHLIQDNSENRSVAGEISPDGGQGNMEGWNIPKPEVIPPPTYWPFVLSFGATLMGFGVLTSYLISLAGIVLFVLAIVKWVGEMCREQ
jgi:hypothetical protein